jgi:L-alanine-DL-glutamate epimerase-like enolase superfamily enzyme
VEPHLYGGPLAFAATLQVAACSPAVRRVELDVRPNPVRDELLVTSPGVVDGQVEVPEGAGLGVVLVEEVRRRIAAPKTNWRQA